MLSPKENMLLVLRHKEPEYMPFRCDFDSAVLDSIEFVNERPPNPGVNKDWFGQSWTYQSHAGAANPTPGVHLVEDVTKWKERLIFPDLDQLDWEGRSKADTANWRRDEKLSRLRTGFGMWERMFSVMDFQDALCALLDEPECCYDFFGAVADHKIRLHQKMIDYYKPDIIVMHDDYGTSQGLFMSPDVWRELIKPHLKRIADHVQSQGCRYEHHNCGYFMPLMDDIVEMGIEMINPLHRSNGLKETKEKYGSKVTLLSGFEVQYLSAPTITEAEIRENVRKTMDILAPGGGYVPYYNGSNADIVNDEIVKYSENFYSPRPL